MLTYSDFVNKYPNSNLSQSKVEALLQIYKRQLGLYFRFNNSVQTKFFDVEFCGSQLVLVPAFEKTTEFKAEKYNVKTRALLPLQEGVDFLFDEFEWADAKYVYALDFGCLGCNCECEKVKITGIYKCQLPKYLEDYIYDMLQEHGQQISTDTCQEIASERIGEYNVTYRANTAKSTSKITAANVFSFPMLLEEVRYLQPYFLDST